MITLVVLLALAMLPLILAQLAFGLLVLAAYRECRMHQALGAPDTRRTADLVDAYRMVHRARRGNW